MDLSPHIKDLITAYENMPITPQRNRILQSLRECYLWATSDSLESLLSTKRTQHAFRNRKPLRTTIRVSNDLYISDTVRFKGFEGIDETQDFKLTVKEN